MCLFITIIITIIVRSIFMSSSKNFTWNNRSSSQLKLIQRFLHIIINSKFKKGKNVNANIFSKYAKNNVSARLKYMFYLLMKAQTHKEMMMGGEWQRITSRYISKLDFRLMLMGLFGSCFYISMILQNDIFTD